MIPYLLLILVTVSAVGYYSYSSSVKSMSETNQVNMNRTLEQISDNIMNQFNDYQKVSDQIYNDINLQRLLLSKQDSYRVYELTEGYIKPALDLAIHLPINDIILSLYINNHDFKEIYSYWGSPRNPFNIRSYFNIMHSDRIKGERWYQNMLRNQKINEWVQINNDLEYDNISSVRRWVSFDTFEEIGVIEVKARLKDLFKSIDSFQLSEGMDVFVVSKDSNQVLYSRSKEMTVWKEDLQASDHLIVSEDLPDTSWRLISKVPRGVFKEEANKIRKVTIGVCLISFVIASLIGLLVSRFFSRRVRHIIHMAHSFQDGEFKRRMNIQGKDEFAIISHTFNSLADNIEGLIQEVYMKSLQKKEAELVALQAQINPHFLYNTLSSISSMSKLGEVEKLGDMVAGLAHFYRLTLNNGQMFISVAKELEQVETYTQIQRLKYGDRFTFISDVDPSILHYDSIKLILQPFVENALKHAWFEGRMTIRITGCLMNGDIVLKVIDDGIGFDPRASKRRENNPESEGGYGIHNVDERIKLQFGSEYGVTLYSRIGIGTTVTIRIPAFKQGASHLIGGSL
jgi:sensor histidine kinase YesM